MNCKLALKIRSTGPLKAALLKPQYFEKAGTAGAHSGSLEGFSALCSVGPLWFLSHSLW